MQLPHPDRTEHTMALNRRHFLGAAGAIGLAPYATPAAPQNHEHFMTAAIEEGRKNERYPFGAVLVRSGQVVGRGVNVAQDGPTYHAEMVAIDDYGQPYGSPEWAGTALYTTAEPCPMCMSACAWAGIGQVVWATSIEGLRRTGLDQIDLSATAVAKAAESFYHPQLLLGGVLATETDDLFRRAQVIRNNNEDGA
ncbi:nucleoside deaminase [Kitasatospora sp. NPDC058162]|uniref:nucleoside deaminase n=1 Tax=Kitasatospora sp. NPDC058162 TaxID=3346362 RepID=UPI0036DD116B